MQPNPAILIVDDDEHVLGFLEACVTDEGYSVVTAPNGRAALQILAEPGMKIDAVLSDVLMPELDGYGLCEQMRANETTAAIPVIFISGQTDLKEKLKGYAVGGDDYITKPVHAEELLVKLRHITIDRQRQAELNQRLFESRQVAMQAMSYTGYLGQVLQFIQDTQNTLSVDQLAQQALQCVSSMGLTGVLQLYAGRPCEQGAQSYQAISPLESNVIELARNQGRFFDFDRRTIINHRDFSLLIKNMPLEDPERYGLLKDVLGNFCNAIEARTNYILSRDLGESRSQALTSVNLALREIDSRFKDVQYANIAAIDKLIDDLEEAMLTLGLTEGQEQQIRSIAQLCLSRTKAIFDESMDLQSKFEAIKHTLAAQMR